MHREYFVTINKGYELAELENELVIDFGSETIPERPVIISDPKYHNDFTTVFLLTDEEAEKLRTDIRVKAVELSPEERGLTLEMWAQNQSGSFTRSGSLNNTDVNWGLRRHIANTNVYGGSTTISGDYTYSRDGTGVDIVITDSGIQADHPDFQDADGNSRVRQIDWYEAAGVAGTMPNGFYTDYDGHGTHVASTAAGKTYGWAKNADIYSMKILGLEGSADPNNGISLTAGTGALDLIRLWHIRKNDPNDPIYTGRPTVVNMSWGYGLTTGAAQSGVYRGTPWTFGVDVTSDAQAEAQYGVPDYFADAFGGNLIKLPGFNTTTDTDVQALCDAGIHVTIASGNKYHKQDLPGGLDYDNTITVQSNTYYYHRPGSPYSLDAFQVGNMSYTQISSLDAVFSSSQKGPAVEIYAAGGAILAACSTINNKGSAAYPPDNSYEVAALSGTSMAAPQVAGLAALHLQANPDLTVSELKARIIDTDSTDVLYDTPGTDYGNSRSLVDGDGFAIFSRYYQDVSEPLSNITLTGDTLLIGQNETFYIDLRNYTSNVQVTNFRSLSLVSGPLNGNINVIDPVTGNISYTPTLDYSGADSVQFTLENNLGNVSTQVNFSISVGQSSPVTPVADYVEAISNTSTVFNVLANDTNANLSTTVIETAPSNGVAILGAAGTIIYTPNAGYYGEDSLQYSAANDDGVRAANTDVNIKVLQQVAVRDLSANVDTNDGGASITISDKLQSYDSNFANVVGLYDFRSSLNNATGNFGDLVLSVTPDVEIMSTLGEHDWNSIHFNSLTHFGATIDSSSINTGPPADRGFLANGDDWTIEFSFKYDRDDEVQSGNKHLLATGDGLYGSLRVFFETLDPYTISVIIGNGQSTGSSIVRGFYNISQNKGQWNKMAIQRNGNNLDIFMNGIRVATNTVTWANAGEMGDIVYLGHFPNVSSTSPDQLYMDNIRFTKAVARYPEQSYFTATQHFPRDATELANPSTLFVSQSPANGIATVDYGNNAINYVPGPSFLSGTDSFKYTVNSQNPTTSMEAVVTLNVFTSAVPQYDDLLVSPQSIDEDGNTVVTFTVLTTDVANGTVVPYAISGTGITVDDISLSSLSGNIVINNNTGSVSFTALPDGVTEGQETLVLVLAAQDSAGTLTGSPSNVVIINDTSLTPPGYISAAFNRASANEDADDLVATLVRFIVTTESMPDNTSVGYSFTGTNITASDITAPLSGNITIVNNTGSVNFFVEEDTLTEGPETLIGTIANVDSNGYNTGGLSDTIILNDTSVTPGIYNTVYFNLANVNEDATTPVIFTVEANAVLDGTTLGYTISGANITTSDISLSSLTGEFTIINDTANLTFTVNADSFTEGPETLTITLDAFDSIGSVTNSLNASIIINDTSTAPVPGTPTYNYVEMNYDQVNEGQNTVSFTVYATDVPGGVLVPWTISGTGITVDDISINNLTGSILMTGNVGSLAFDITNDEETEGPETLTITLGPLDNVGNPTGNLSASVIINDTSREPIYANVSFDVPSITENGTDVATFTVNTIDVPQNTLVGYTITGVTVDSISLSSLTGQLVIDGNTASVSFTATDDSITEGDQVLTITLNNFDQNGVNTGNLSASVTILDTSAEILTPAFNDLVVSYDQYENDPGDIIEIDFINRLINPGGNYPVLNNYLADVQLVTHDANAYAQSAIVFFASDFPGNANVTIGTLRLQNINPDYYGNDTIQVSLLGPASENYSTGNITFSITEAPVATNDTADVNENENVLINLVTNDSGGPAPLDVTTITIIQNPSNGSVINNLDGTVIYTPNFNYSGTDLFTYTIKNLDGTTSNEANVTVNIIPEFIPPNLPPVLEDDLFYIAVNGSQEFDVLSNDTDPDDGIDPSTVYIVTPSANATLVVQGSGNILYTPNTDFTGEDSFTYNVKDFSGQASPDFATVTVFVLAAPIAVDDTANTFKNTSVTINVPGNDYDPDGNIVPDTVTLVDNGLTGNGIANVLPGGNILYTPNQNFVGTDTFTYTIEDETGILSGPGTVTVNVLRPPAIEVQRSFSVQSSEIESLVVQAPVSMLELVTKFAPGVDPDSRSFNLGYFYNNITYAYSKSTKPQVKIIGYNPSVYPRTNAADRTPIDFSDFIGYLYYFQPFPTPKLQIEQLTNVKGWASDGADYFFNVNWTVDWQDALWPVNQRGPRPSPQSYTYVREVVATWFRDGEVIGRSVQTGKSSGTFTSPALQTPVNLGDQDIPIRVEVVAQLKGPDDSNPRDIQDTGNYVHSINDTQSDATFVVRVYQPYKPKTTVFDFLGNKQRQHYITTYRRLVDNSIVPGPLDSVNEIKYPDSARSYETDFDMPSPGRFPTNYTDWHWELRDGTDGEWFIDTEADVTEKSWKDNVVRDGLDNQPDYSGYQLRFTARGRQELIYPTATNQEDTRKATSEITLAYATQYLYPLYILSGAKKIPKGAPLTIDLKPFNDGAGVKTYTWNIYPEVPGEPNEFTVTQGTVSVEENLIIDGDVIGTVNSGQFTTTCNVGETDGINYVLEIRAGDDPGLTGTPLYNETISTYQAPISYEWKVINYKPLNSTRGKLLLNVDNHTRLDTEEEAVIQVQLWSFNAPVVEGDTFSILNTQTTGDATGVNDIQHRAFASGDPWTNVNNGERFSIPCVETTFKTNIEPPAYVGIFTFEIRAKADALFGGDTANYEEYSFDAYDAASGGNKIRTLNARFYDKASFYFAIVGNLKVVNPEINTVNGVVTSTKDGYVSWDTFNIDAQTGFNDHYLLNPGPEYAGVTIFTDHVWQYFNKSSAKWVNFRRNGDNDFVTTDANMAWLSGSGDEGFKFTDVKDTIQGGIQWGSGVQIRHRAFAIVSGTNEVIATETSDPITVKIKLTNTESSKGISSVKVSGYEEGKDLNATVTTSGMIGKTVSFSSTNNNYYGEFNGDFTISKDVETFNLGKIPVLRYYDSSATEELTATVSAGVSGYTQRSVSYDIKQAAPVISSLRYRRTDAVKGFQNAVVWSNGGTLSTVEGGKFGINFQGANLPDEQIYIQFSNLVLGGGTKINNSLIETYISGIDGYKDSKPIINFSKVFLGNTPPTSATDANKLYNVYMNDDRDVKFDETSIYGFTVDFVIKTDNTSFGLSGSLSVINTIPEPWDPGGETITITAKPNPAKEDGTSEFVFGGDKVWFAAATSAPASTPVYWRVNSNSTAVDGVNFDGAQNDNVLYTNSSGAVEQPRPGLVSGSSVENFPLYFPLINDNVYKASDLVLSVDMSFYSDFREFNTGSGKIRNINPAPIAKPDLSFLPDSVEMWRFFTSAGHVSTTTQWTFFSTSQVRHNNGDLSATDRQYPSVVVGSWVPDGANVEDYEFKVQIIPDHGQTFNIDSFFSSCVRGTGQNVTHIDGGEWLNLVATKGLTLTVGYKPPEIPDVIDPKTFQVKISVRAKNDHNINASKSVTVFIDRVTVTSSSGSSGGSEGGGTGCPAPFEPIQVTEHGDCIAAGDLQVGDMIYTEHEHTHEPGYYAVTHAEIITEHRFLITFDDGSDITVSRTHQFHVHGEFVQANLLNVGDMVADRIITGKQEIGYGDVVRLTIDDAHTYIVKGLLSHNKKAVDDNNVIDFKRTGK